MKALTSTFVVCLIALSVVTAAPTGKPEDVGLSASRLQRISDMIQRRIAAGELAGAVTVVARRGKIAHLSAQGVMDLESKQPMTAGTMFRIASMTKPVVGVAIMMMVEEGRLHLNDPVSRYIPEFRGMKVGVPQAGADGRGAQPAGGRGTPAGGGRGAPPQFDTVPAQREITIKDLLTHVSGLGSGPMGNSDIDKVARKEGEKLADYIPRLGRTTLEFQPGSRWTYSPGAGFETLGRIVEIASGMPLDRFVRTRIFDPLGMRDITFWPTDAQLPRVASVYARGEKGLTKQQTPNDTMSRNVYFRGSGGLYSTAEDYAAFGMMLANNGELNGKRLLGRKTVEMLGAAHVPDTLPGRPAGEGYGLSVRVVTNHAARGTMLSDGTYGWSGAQGTHFFVDPKEQLVGVLMVQTSIQEVQREFEDLVAQAVVD
ncbi:MAG TPA: serine hydrolase domain-containing protein [Vicinamibacterales bacterium]|nr:serine hydrolase domain-containing protein [Vicinamibacterales bacterium]